MESQRQHRLVVTEGPDTGRTYQLQGMVCTLGRASDNTIMLDSSRISRHHAQIRLLPAGAVIEDMGSTNGTFVNNRRLVEPQRLASGDVIRLADYVSMEYVAEELIRTEVLGSGSGRGGTQVIPEGPDYQPQPTVPAGGRAFDEPYQPPVSQEVVYEPYAPAVQYETPAPAAGPAPVRKRPRALYAVIGVLVVLLCLCIAAGVYLWFAPATFWERVFDLLGIPMPTGMLVNLASLLWL